MMNISEASHAENMKQQVLMTIYVNVQKDAVYIYSTGLKGHTYKVL